MRRLGVVAVSVLTASVIGCGSWKRVGSEEQPRPTETLTRLLNTQQFYQRLGRLAALESSPDAEVRNMATAALLIAASAYARTESRGGHFRSDFPKADPAQAHRSFITLADARKIAARAAAKAA